MKGLLFTPEMARAVIAGRKTQTRRVVPGKLKQYEEGWSLNGDAPRTCASDWCQYQPGATVCMLTTWAVAKQFDHLKPTELSPRIAPVRFWHAGSGSPKPGWAGKSRPGRFLPNKLRHLMPALKILDVDVQRVRDIKEADAIAEGVEGFREFWRNYLKFTKDGIYYCVPSARHSFRTLWNSINSERGYGWRKNPQVFVIKFEEVLPF